MDVPNGDARQTEFVRTERTPSRVVRRKTTTKHIPDTAYASYVLRIVWLGKADSDKTFPREYRAYNPPPPRGLRATAKKRFVVTQITTPVTNDIRTNFTDLWQYTEHFQRRWHVESGRYRHVTEIDRERLAPNTEMADVEHGQFAG